jgi:hypothetical protein
MYTMMSQGCLMAVFAHCLLYLPNVTELTVPISFGCFLGSLKCSHFVGCNLEVHALCETLRIGLYCTLLNLDNTWQVLALVLTMCGRSMMAHL